MLAYCKKGLALIIRFFLQKIIAAVGRPSLDGSIQWHVQYRQKGINYESAL
jgi:hypothetical protein